MPKTISSPGQARGDHPRPRSIFSRLADVNSAAAILLLALIMAAVCGIFVHQHALILLCVVAVVLALGVTWPFLSLYGVSAELHFDGKRIRAGEPLIAMLVVRNRGLLPAFELALHGLTSSGSPVSIPPLATREFQQSLSSTKRGKFPAGQVALRCSFPFGLRTSAVRVRLVDEVLIWPARLKAPIPLPYPTASSGHTVHRRAEIALEHDTVGARAYRRGDPMKLLHRSQTARYDALIIRETMPVSGKNIRLAVDCAPESYLNAEHRELALSAVADFLEVTLAEGVNVELIVNGRRHRLDVNGFSMALDALALAGDDVGPPDAIYRTLGPGPATVVTSITVAARQNSVISKHGNVAWIGIPYSADNTPPAVEAYQRLQGI